MKIKKNIIIIILSLLLGFMQIIGFYISSKYNTTVHYLINKVINYQSPMLLFCLIFFIFTGLCFFVFQKWFSYLDKPAGKTAKIILFRNHPKIRGFFTRFRYPLIAVLLFLFWIPWLMASNPGFFNYDVIGQLTQVLYHDTNPYVNHHPLLHTWIMGHIITYFYYASGEDLPFGILCFNLFQMAICSVFFSYYIYFLNKIKTHPLIQIGAFIYYATFPTIVFFTMSTTKDVFCFLFLQLAVLKIYEFFQNGSDNLDKNKKNLPIIVLSLTLSCLFRKNVVYALLFLFVVYLFSQRKKALLFSCTLLCSILLFFLAEKGLMLALHATQGGAAEMFSVPIQQIARTYNQYGREALLEEELYLIDHCISSDNIQNYNPVISDSVKNFCNFSVVTKNKMDYLKLWISLGRRYPATYITSFLENTYQAWYPGTSIVVNPVVHQIYYFDCDMNLNIERTSLLPSLMDYIREISHGETYQKYPVIRLLYSIGFMFWLLLITLFYGLYSKKETYLWPSLLVFSICLTNFLGPVSLVRYYLVLFYGFPFWAALLLTKGRR